MAVALDQIVAQHGAFFDGLVGLVLAKHYFDSETEPLNLRYMKKDARAEAKKQFKEQYKQNKKEKLKPDAALTALDVQKQKRQAAASEGSKQQQPKGMPSLQLSNEPALSREQLREKLQKKLEAIRAQRSAQEAAAAPAPKDPAVDKKKQAAQKAREWRQAQLAQGAKAAAQRQQQEQQAERHQQQQQQGSVAGKRPHGAADAGAAAKRHKPSPGGDGAQQQQHRKDAGGGAAGGDVGAELAFGRIDLPDDKRRGGAFSKKKTKTAELLKQAEEAAKSKAQLAATQEGREKLKTEAWGAALQRARGEKVLDDPKLLRKSLKAQNKKREKSAKAWKERHSLAEGRQKQQQQKRNENLAARRDAKLATKKEKREKKLVRAGFEGRKDGFIEPKAKAAAA